MSIITVVDASRDIGHHGSKIINLIVIDMDNIKISLLKVDSPDNHMLVME